MEQGLQTERVAILPIPTFQMLSFFLTVETLRVANRIAGKELYEWVVVSLDGGPVTASNGMSVAAQFPISNCPPASTAFVTAGYDIDTGRTKPVLDWVRRMHRHGSRLVGLDAGPFSLAEAGLLDGRRATLHWESLEAFREAYPDVHVTDEVFELSGDVATSPAGMATIDLILGLIAERHGTDLAEQVAVFLIHDRIRKGGDIQRSLSQRVLSMREPGVGRAIRMMEENLETPVSIGKIAKQAGMSERKLQRLFAIYFNQSPLDYYRTLRLERARQLVCQTNIPLVEISVSCGFESQSWFSRAYRQRYDISPSDHRQQYRRDFKSLSNRAPVPITTTGWDMGGYNFGS
ncbi:GlxA family transcriptional regulator [Aestuariispira insulae]|uniref:AraC family transcriptional regulator with amidase-like domain n=1 Tax=Aestuariispira insulae TaxID=1461337 RepID=A0A3D9HJS0_9PROT|nr:GlxA family transcriptional regulator [Aestuariispira insulae]RED49718.1 AraC family transcriptional regulator with amidase-like domain [Aestuariispira insulae]